MIDWFREINPILQALLATGFTWFVTALGAGLIFVFGGDCREESICLPGGIPQMWYAPSAANI